jgi:hypothetical protein
MRVAVDRPLAETGSSVAFRGEIVPSSVSKMKVAGTLVEPTVVVKAEVGLHTIVVGVAVGGADFPAGNGTVMVRLVLAPLPS